MQITSGSVIGEAGTSDLARCAVYCDRFFFYVSVYSVFRPQKPSGLSYRSAAARLLRLWVRIPPEA